MMIATLLVALVCVAPAASHAPVPQCGDGEERALVANADGSWTIRRAIEEDLPLFFTSDGLVADDHADEARREKEDEALEESAFEEAIDKARSAEEPR